MFMPSKNIIINSKEELFIFELSNERNIAYNRFDSNLSILASDILSEEKVLNYATTIDQYDTIHLVALISSGELHYYRYTNEEWQKNTIAKFNLKSNIYNQLEIFIIKDKLHLIYNYSNIINSNIWTIQHIVYDNKREEQYNAIRYLSKKTPDPFIVDVDDLGNIHILYMNYINNSQVYHSFYSPYTKVWNPHPKLMSSDTINNLFPYLFIDSNNNIHCLWVEDLNDRFNLRMMKMSSSGKEKYTWKKINLPHIFIFNGYPFMFELDNKLHLVFISKNNIQCFQSKDYGDSWIRADDEFELNQSTMLVKSSLSPLHHPDKVKLTYLDETNGELYFLNQLFSEKRFTYSEIIDTNKEDIEEITSYHTDEDIQLEAEESIPTYILELNEKLDEIINNQLSIINNLEKIIHIQNASEIKLDALDTLNTIENLLKEGKKSFWDKLFKS